MFLNIKVFEDLCAYIFGKDLKKIRIPEMLHRRISQVREAFDSGKQLHESFSMVPLFLSNIRKNGGVGRIKRSPVLKFRTHLVCRARIP